MITVRPRDTQTLHIVHSFKLHTNMFEIHRLISPILTLKLKGVDTAQDFLIKLGIKPHKHVLEIRIFSLYHLIVRPTKL